MRVQKWTRDQKFTKAKELSSQRGRRRSHKKLEKERTRAKAKEKKIQRTKRIKSDCLSPARAYKFYSIMWDINKYEAKFIND